MNHVAFDVSPDKIDEYRERLVKAGVDVTPVVNHDASENQASKEITPTTFVRSIYFLDPDGIQLEFAAWTRELDESDVNCEPHSTVER
jgi:catechol 2,3-dioxygenase-like lactoylglutathione lyase family enzyme